MSQKETPLAADAKTSEEDLSRRLAERDARLAETVETLEHLQAERDHLARTLATCREEISTLTGMLEEARRRDRELTRLRRELAMRRYMSRAGRLWSLPARGRRWLSRRGNESS